MRAYAIAVDNDPDLLHWWQYLEYTFYGKERFQTEKSGELFEVITTELNSVFTQFYRTTQPTFPQQKPAVVGGGSGKTFSFRP